MSRARPAVGTLGVPRDEIHVELKVAFDATRAGCLSERCLAELCRSYRVAGWLRLKAMGVLAIPSNDFGLHGHAHEAGVMVGLVSPGEDGYFQNRRERQPSAFRTDDRVAGVTRAFMRWYGAEHCEPLPPLHPDQSFARGSVKPVSEFLEAELLGIRSRPVLVGPASLLSFAGSAVDGFDPLDLLERVLPIWRETLEHLHRAGADWVQIDEPGLGADPSGRLLQAVDEACHQLAGGPGVPKILLTTGGADPATVLPTLVTTPIDGIHLDATVDLDRLDEIPALVSDDLFLSLGVVDAGRARRSDLAQIFERLRKVFATRAAELIELAPSCSLGRLPFDSPFRSALSRDQREHLAFGADKIAELDLLAAALAGGRSERRSLSEPRRSAAARLDEFERSPKGRRVAAE